MYLHDLYVFCSPESDNDRHLFLSYKKALYTINLKIINSKNTKNMI